jgi:hypothetical protein
MDDLMEQLLSESRAARRRIPEPQQVRPLTDLLTRPPPEDWAEQKTFEREIELAEKAFKAAHPLGLNRSELEVALEVGDDVRLVCAQKLCQNERLVRYLDAQYDIASRCGKDWVSSADATVLARWLEDNGHELHIWVNTPAGLWTRSQVLSLAPGSTASWLLSSPTAASTS